MDAFIKEVETLIEDSSNEPVQEVQINNVEGQVHEETANSDGQEIIIMEGVFSQAIIQ